MPDKRKRLDPFSGPSEERIVYTRTEDNLDLRGALIRAAGDQGKPRLLILWVHTRQQNFAEKEYIEIGRRVVRPGCAFLSVDTRGHDFGSWFRGEQRPVLHGSAWELFTDCIFDLDAWVEWARSAGYTSIFLVGYGFGGAKVVHYQAQQQRPEIVALGLASSGAAVRDKFTDEGRELARRMVAEGRGRDLMPWGTGGDTYDSTVSAEWYMARAEMNREVYGDGRTPPAIARVRVPIFAWYGTREERPMREVSTFLERLRRDAIATPAFDGKMVPGLGYFYQGHEDKIVAVLNAALARLGLGQPA